MARSARSKMIDYRRRLRDQGLRPIQLWVPDLRDLELLAELQAEIRMLKDHPSTREGDAFVEAALDDLEKELQALEGNGG